MNIGMGKLYILCIFGLSLGMICGKKAEGNSAKLSLYHAYRTKGKQDKDGPDKVWGAPYMDDKAWIVLDTSAYSDEEETSHLENPLVTEELESWRKEQVALGMRNGK